METIFIKAATESPEINFDFRQGHFQIKGRSSLRYPTSFFKPFLTSLDNYVATAADVTIVSLYFESLNNASTRWIFDILKIFEDIHTDGKTVIVKWYFEKESQRKLGYHFQSLVNLPFKMVQMQMDRI